jgi:adenylate cyclase
MPTPEPQLPHQVEEALRRLKRAEILLRIYERTAVLSSIDEVLTTITEIACEETRAERGSLFLLDETTGELHARVAQGRTTREIRVDKDRGVAGHVFKTGEGVIVTNAEDDPRFDPSVDQRTGFHTHSILCAPLRTMKGETIGVLQTLNRSKGAFTQDDLRLLEAMGKQASVAIQSNQVIERMNKTRAQELKFLEIVAEITSEIEIKALLRKVMDEATAMLDAERSTIFLNDEKTQELWSLVGAGLEATAIRFPNTNGIAGMVFSSGESVEIPYAYADLRFNPTFDKATGFFTRSILCVPVVNKSGKTIGVIQVLNKRGGPFTNADESRLRAFSAQVSIALENARLFDDVQNMKNYNESILESMSSGVITLDEKNQVLTCNAAGLAILSMRAEDILEQPGEEVFRGPNAWVMDIIRRVVERQSPEMLLDMDLESSRKQVSVNLTAQPLISVDQERLGTMLMIDDISSEKRMKSTMSRYLDASIVDELLKDGGESLGGQSNTATILFCDIRGFTTLSEALGANGTVSLLNEYFTIMTEQIQEHHGMVDKFIGDAIMAAFGVPLTSPDDEDHAVQATIAMMRELEVWNARRLDEGRRQVEIGIGLSTDIVVSGNIGSPKRMDFTLIGDGVNLASRLEGACKEYGTKVLISEHTKKRLKGSYQLREVDQVRVKGKTIPVTVFEVLDHYSETAFPHRKEVLGHFAEGLEQYRAFRFPEAIRSFQRALQAHPEDFLSKLYVQRCENLLVHPPREDWDGVFQMTHK